MKKENYSDSIAGISLLLFILITILLASAKCSKIQEAEPAEKCDVAGLWWPRNDSDAPRLQFTGGILFSTYLVGDTPVNTFAYQYFTSNDTVYLFPKDAQNVSGRMVVKFLGQSCDVMEIYRVAPISQKITYERK